MCTSAVRLSLFCTNVWLLSVVAGLRRLDLDRVLHSGVNWQHVHHQICDFGNAARSRLVEDDLTGVPPHETFFLDQTLPEASGLCTSRGAIFATTALVIRMLMFPSMVYIACFASML